MKDNYLISIKAQQIVDTTIDSFDFITYGNYIEKNDNKYIIYKEYDEKENNSPGSYHTNIIKIISNKIVILNQVGATRSQLIFENKKRYHSAYITQFGKIMSTIFTNKIDLNLSKSGGYLILEYFLDLGSVLTSINSINIQLEEKNLDV